MARLPDLANQPDRDSAAVPGAEVSSCSGRISPHGAARTHNRRPSEASHEGGFSMSPSEQIKAIYEKYPDLPDVTWIGPNFQRPGLMLGFDEGSILFTNAATGEISDPQRVSPSGEAINGIASIGPNSLAVSTRSEVSLFQAESPGDQTIVSFPGGAHGVVATRSGSYVAPLGPKGLLIVRPSSSMVQGFAVTQGTEGHLYFYRMAALHNPLGVETLVFANRKNGVGMSVFDSEDRRRVVRVMKFQDVDIVDVCAVVPGSLSAIAVSKTADLLWITDTSSNVEPVILRPMHVKGTVYRVLATSRHLVVLTSEALHVWIDLVGRALTGQFASPDMTMLVMPIDAVDMALIDDQHLLLVMGMNAVTCLTMADMERQFASRSAAGFRLGGSSGRFEKTSLDDIHQDWRTEDVEQRELVLA